MAKQRTITLTDRRPIRIDDDAWPIVAVGKWHEGQHESQANRTAAIRVREHGDGRRIVYGVATSAWQGEGGASAGYLLDAAAGDDATVRAIHDVAARIGHPDLAADCIADLPAEVVS